MPVVEERRKSTASADPRSSGVAQTAGRRPRSSFAALLRGRRLAEGLTQAALAELAGLSARGVQNLERGIAQPRRVTAARLASALRLDGASRAALLAAAAPRPRGGRRSVAVRSPEARSRPSPAPASLPAPVASFVGRERQIEEVQGLLQAQRLVTLTGTGGAGKTRLAIEVAARVRDRFGDGARFVSLASIGDPGLVEAAVIRALGLWESPGQPARRTLELALGDAELLLVVDNFEHLLDAVRLVNDWLELCPRLTILVTSREPLRLSGEQVYSVPPLTLPGADDGRRTTDDGMAVVGRPSSVVGEAEAVRLFVERARSVRSDFRLTDENAPAVAEICRRLDGLPLAIELAAARASTLSPEQIAARLDDGDRLLTNGSRAAPPRQQTLRAALDWSYALLSEAERVMLRRLSVFVGGFTLEAADWVSGDGEVVCHPGPFAGAQDKLREG